jgi:hypothetical protein
MKKVIKKDYRRCKDTPFSWIGRINIVKMANKSNLPIQRNSHQNPKNIYHRDWKIYPRVHLETQKTMNSQDNSWQKTNPGGIIIPDFKLRYRGIAIKTAWCWHNNRYEGHCNRIEDLDMNPHIYAHLIFDKSAQNIWWRNNSLFNKCC